MSTSTTGLAERIIATLRAHEEELRAAGKCGTCHCSAPWPAARPRAPATWTSPPTMDPYLRMDLFRLTALERRIAELLARPVDLLPEPAEKQRLQAKIDRDRRRAF